MVYLFYATYISVDIAYHEVFSAKVGKGGINKDIHNPRVFLCIQNLGILFRSECRYACICVCVQQTSVFNYRT